MHFQIIFFAILSITKFTFEIFDSLVSLDMLFQVANLTEGSVATFVCAFMGLLFGMCHQMTIEFCYTMNYLRALSDSIFVFVLALKYFILFLEVKGLLNEVEFELITFSNHFCVSELTWVKVFSFENGDLVVWLDIMLVHELI